MRNDGGVDFHQPVRASKGGHHHAGRNRMTAEDVFVHGAVHRLAVAHIGKVDDDLAQMLYPAAAFADQLPDVASPCGFARSGQGC